MRELTHTQNTHSCRQTDPELPVPTCVWVHQDTAGRDAGRFQRKQIVASVSSGWRQAAPAPLAGHGAAAGVGHGGGCGMAGWG